MLARWTLCRLVTYLAVIPTAVAAQADKIPWVKGPTKGVLGTEASIGVPAGCLFTGMDGVKVFLEVTENPGSGNERGDVMCQVDMQVGDNHIVAVITREAADEMGLQVGMEAIATFKSTSVMIATHGGAGGGTGRGRGLRRLRGGCRLGGDAPAAR